MTIVVLLGLSYIIHVWGLTYEKEHTKGFESQLQNNIIDKLPIIQLCFVWLALFLTVIGSIIYMGNKKKEYGKDFSYSYFFLGKPTCKGKSPNTNIIDDFKYAFK